MKKLTDFKLNKEYQCADGCQACGKPMFAKITHIEGNYGDVLLYCKECDYESYDMIGQEYHLTEKITIKGKEFPLVIKSTNIAWCLNCGKIVAGVPLLIFVQNDYMLIFCFNCVKELALLEEIKIE